MSKWRNKCVGIIGIVGVVVAAVAAAVAVSSLSSVCNDDTIHFFDDGDDVPDIFNRLDGRRLLVSAILFNRLLSWGVLNIVVNAVTVTTTDGLLSIYSHNDAQKYNPKRKDT